MPAGMATERGVKTIEYNVRFGDPETEVLMIALQDDLYEICMQVLQHQTLPLHWSKEPVLGVVLASQGYPESSTKGAKISNLEQVDATVFHMGTAIENGQLVTSGGRVLFVAAQRPTLKQAQAAAYAEIEKLPAMRCFTVMISGRGDCRIVDSEPALRYTSNTVRRPS